jgi:hypothetical protein
MTNPSASQQDGTANATTRLEKLGYKVLNDKVVQLDGK